MVFQFIVFKVYLTFVEAVILILKHATLLQLSESYESALTHAELSYQMANVDLNVHQVLASSENSVKKFVEFIMTTDIGTFVLVFAIKVSYQAFSAISVFSQHTCILVEMVSENQFVSYVLYLLLLSVHQVFVMICEVILNTGVIKHV